jgi:gliding motility-associated-like protein
MNPVCEGGTLLLNGGPSGMSAYEWTGPNGFTSTEQSPQIPSVTAINAGKYSLRITTPSGCKNSFETTINVNTVLFNGTYGPYCISDAPVVLSVSPAGGVFTGQGVNGSTFDPRAAGVGTHVVQYTFTGTSGCSILATKIIDVVTVPRVTITNQVLKSCTGSFADLTLPSVTAGSTPGLIFTYWTDPKATVALASPKNVGSGQYYIKGATGSGKCFDIQSVIVGQPDSLHASILASQELNCAGDTTGTLSVNITMGTAPYTYLWSTRPAQNTPTAVNLGAGIYTVVVTDAKMCSASFTGEITEPAPLKLGFEVKPVQCLSDVNGSAKVDTINGSVDVNVLNSYKYKWSTNPVQTTREAVRLSSLWHTVTLTSPKGCVLKDSVFIHVLDVTPPAITAPKDIDLTVQYIRSTDGTPNKYTIDIGKPLVSDNCAVDTVTNDSPVKFRAGLTYVKWTVTDQVGLTDTATQRVFIKEIPIVPQLISPNGDGVNDKFVIDGLEQFPNTQLLIFTRSGQLVFQNDNYEMPENAWDGRYSESTFSKNRMVAPGVYYYILKLGGSSGQTLKGYLYVYY